MWQWYLGVAILDLVGLFICLYFVYRHKRKAKAIQHYEDIRDELTVRKEIAKESLVETCKIGGVSIIGNLVGALIVLGVGFSLMGAVTEQIELAQTELNVTDTTQNIILNAMPLFMVLGLLSAGVVIMLQGLRAGGLMGV